MAFWDAWSGQLKGLWSGLSGRDRMVLVAGLSVAVLGPVLFVFGWGAEGYEPVSATPFDTAEQAKAMQALTAAGIPARVEGPSVQVPRSRRAEALMHLAREEAMPTQKYGFYDLVSSQPFPGAQEQGENRRIATQFVLEESIGTIRGVQSARVILNPGDASPSVLRVDREMGKPTASVLLRLGSRDRLDDETVQAVRNLVSGSWKGLLPADVQVSDTAGRVYDLSKGAAFAQASSLLMLQQQVEAYYVRKVQSLFHSMPGVVAVVDAKLKASEVERQINRVNPEEIATLFAKSTEERKEHAGSTLAPVGVTSNLGTDTAGQESPVKLVDTKTEEEIQNDVTRIIEQIKEKPGEVLDLTASVMIPRRPGAADAERDAGAYVAYAPELLASFKKQVMRACGIEEESKVEVMDFDPPAGFYPETEPWWRSVLVEALRRPAQWILGVSALLAVFFLYRIAHGPAEPLPAPAEPAAEMPKVKLPELSPAEQMESQVKAAVEGNPQLAAGLIKRWLLEDR